MRVGWTDFFLKTVSATICKNNSFIYWKYVRPIVMRVGGWTKGSNI